MISGWPETGFLPRRRVTVRKFWKKTGFLGILTADVGGCTLMDADEFSFVLTYGFVWVTVGGNLVFSRRVCYCSWKSGKFVMLKKPGFLGILTARVAINRVFMRILRYRAKRWEKTRFMKVLNRRFSC
jgi:hypothetical protein